MLAANDLLTFLYDSLLQVTVSGFISETVVNVDHVAVSVIVVGDSGHNAVSSGVNRLSPRTGDVVSFVEFGVIAKRIASISE